MKMLIQTSWSLLAPLLAAQLAAGKQCTPRIKSSELASAITYPSTVSTVPTITTEAIAGTLSTDQNEYSSETSIATTSSTETSSAEASSTETSLTDSSAIETSATETSVVETSAIETSALETSAVETPIEMPIETPINTSTETPINTPVETPIETPIETPTDTPINTPVETPIETPINTPVETPIETPIDTPIETPIETPIDTPIETPIETPIDTPIETPINTPVQTPINTPINTPIETPIETPINTPVETPIETPIDTPIETPIQTPTANSPIETPIDTPIITPVETPITTAAPTAALACGTNIIVNPGFENGDFSWKLVNAVPVNGGGLVSYGVIAGYAYLDDAKPAASFTQTISGLRTDGASYTIGVYYALGYIQGYRSQPPTTCKLAISFNGQQLGDDVPILQGPAASYSHVERTVIPTANSGDLVFDVSCTGSDGIVILIDDTSMITPCPGISISTE